MNNQTELPNYNNAVIMFQLPAVPSDKLCAQFQAMKGGTVGSALNECLVQGTVISDSQEALWQVPKGSPFAFTVEEYYSAWGIR
jgi:hypothetical protein